MARRLFLFATMQVMSSCCALNVALGSFHAMGHIQPLLPLAHGLACRGHSVTIYVPRPVAYSTRSQLKRRHAHPEIRVMETGEDPDRVNLVWRTPATLSYKMFEPMMEMISKDRADVVVSDFLSWSVCDVAERLDIPCVEIQPNLGFESNYISPFQFSRAMPVQYSGFGQDMSFWQRVSNRVQSLVFGIGKFSALIHLNLLRWKRNLTTLYGLPGFDHSWVPRPTVRTTAWGFEFPHSVSPLVKMVGPMMWNESNYEPISNSLKDWFDFVESNDGVVVYISFGTNLQHFRKTMKKLYGRLCNNYNRQGNVWFLWSLARNTTSEKDLDVFVSCKEHLRIERWVPQQSVLSRPSVRLFVSHGGANSVHESLAEAVPVIVVPLGLDQFDVAARLEAVGAGIKITSSPTRFLNAEDHLVNEIVNVTLASLGNHVLANRAKFVRDIFRRSSGVNGAVDYIEEVAILGWHHRIPTEWRCCAHSLSSFSSCSTLDSILCFFDMEDLPVVVVLVLLVLLSWKYPTHCLGLVLNVWFLILVIYGGEEEVLGTMWPVWRGNMSGTKSILHDNNSHEF